MTSVGSVRATGVSKGLFHGCLWAITSDSMGILIASLENQGRMWTMDINSPQNLYNSESLRKEKGDPERSLQLEKAKNPASY